MKSIVAKLAMATTAALLVGALAMPARADHQSRTSPFRGGPPGFASGGGHQHYGYQSGFSHGRSRHADIRHSQHHGHGHNHFHGSPGYGRGGFGSSCGSPYGGYRPSGYSPGGLGIYLPRLGVQLRF